MLKRQENQCISLSAADRSITQYQPVSNNSVEAKTAGVSPMKKNPGDQSENRQGAWSETLRQFAVAGRRGDRITLLHCICPLLAQSRHP
jgi:hypothetical protein